MLCHRRPLPVMQMSIVQVIDVIAVSETSVPATGSMGVGMIGVNFATHAFSVVGRFLISRAK
jgi:hypothetical protein